MALLEASPAPYAAPEFLTAYMRERGKSMARGKNLPPQRAIGAAYGLNGNAFPPILIGPEPEIANCKMRGRRARGFRGYD
jgi:hypothetical protein